MTGSAVTSQTAVKGGSMHDVESLHTHAHMHTVHLMQPVYMYTYITEKTCHSHIHLTSAPMSTHTKPCHHPHPTPPSLIPPLPPSSHLSLPHPTSPSLIPPLPPSSHLYHTHLIGEGVQLRDVGNSHWVKCQRDILRLNIAVKKLGQTEHTHMYVHNSYSKRVRNMRVVTNT